MSGRKKASTRLRDFPSLSSEPVVSSQTQTLNGILRHFYFYTIPRAKIFCFILLHCISPLPLATIWLLYCLGHHNRCYKLCNGVKIGVERGIEPLGSRSKSVTTGRLMLAPDLVFLITSCPITQFTSNGTCKYHISGKTFSLYPNIQHYLHIIETHTGTTSALHGVQYPT